MNTMEQKVNEIYRNIATEMVINDIKELAYLLLCSTATEEEIEEYKALTDLEDREDNKFALVWNNIAFKEYLDGIPMITLRKADNMLIFWLDDEEDPIIPRLLLHTEMELKELRRIRDLMRRKLEETDIRTRTWFVALKHGILIHD